MEPGKCYTITIDDVDNVYRFKKTSDGAFNTKTKEALAYTEGDNPVRGWNGLGNGTTKHVDLSAEGITKVQIYNHAQKKYLPVDIDEYTYVVGSAYFIQAVAPNSKVIYKEGTKSDSYLRAPQHTTEKVYHDYKLKLRAEGSDNEIDRIYVGATEDAIDSYEIGHDLSKFGNPTEAKVAQVWANAYEMKLCDVEMRFVENEAECPISLYTPTAGNYTLTVEREQEDAELYLTQNGDVIWNLSLSPYTFDLAKGTTEGYGLRIVANEPSDVMTGVDETANTERSMQKVLIDHTIYIVTPDGAMYSATGKKVR